MAAPPLQFLIEPMAHLNHAHQNAVGPAADRPANVGPAAQAALADEEGAGRLQGGQLPARGCGSGAAIYYSFDQPALPSAPISRFVTTRALRSRPPALSTSTIF